MRERKTWLGEGDRERERLTGGGELHSEGDASCPRVRECVRVAGLMRTLSPRAFEVANEMDENGRLLPYWKTLPAPYQVSCIHKYDPTCTIHLAGLDKASAIVKVFLAFVSSVGRESETGRRVLAALREEDFEKFSTATTAAAIFLSFTYISESSHRAWRIPRWQPAREAIASILVYSHPAHFACFSCSPSRPRQTAAIMDRPRANRRAPFAPRTNGERGQRQRHPTTHPPPLPRRPFCTSARAHPSSSPTARLNLP